MITTDINNQSVLDEIKLSFESDIIAADEPYGMLSIVFNSSKIHEFIAWLKSHPQIQANFLTDICGAHFPEMKDQELCVVYHMHSLTNNFRIRIKCFVALSQPQIASVTDLFSCANWMERETYDFYGIEFLGHPNLTRILNVEEMDYFPLRKEFPLEDGTRSDKDDRYFGR
jgi:NADH-quinone oxidoreductase subunit C